MDLFMGKFKKGKYLGWLHSVVVSRPALHAGPGFATWIHARDAHANAWEKKPIFRDPVLMATSVGQGWSWSLGGNYRGERNKIKKREYSISKCYK